MNLDNLNLVELNAQEVQEVEGGFDFKKLIKRAGLAWLATEIMDNWADVKQGALEGWNDASK